MYNVQNRKIIKAIANGEFKIVAHFDAQPIGLVKDPVPGVVFRIDYPDKDEWFRIYCSHKEGFCSLSCHDFESG